MRKKGILLTRSFDMLVLCLGYQEHEKSEKRIYTKYEKRVGK